MGQVPSVSAHRSTTEAVQEYASLLGLVEGKPDDGLLSKEATVEERKQAFKIHSTYSQINIQDSHAFWTELVLRFLPSYLYYHFGRPLPDITDALSYELWYEDTGGIGSALGLTSTIRFTEENPETALTYYLEQAKRLAWFPESLKHDDHAIALILPILIMNLGISFRALLKQPSLGNRVRVDKHTLKRLQALLPLMRRVRDLIPKDQVYGFDEGGDTFIGIISGKLTAKVPDNADYDPKRRAAFRCGAKRVDPSLVCAPPPVGGEMEDQEILICEQCKMVRYCSREHQKISWKTQGHKALCFQTTW